MAFVMIFLFSIPFVVPKSITQYTAIYDVSEADKELFRVAGMEIIKVDPDSPAEKAGLTTGIVITSFNDVSINDTERFASATTNRTPGEQITLIANDTAYAITLAPDPKDPEHGIMGVHLGLKTEPNPAAIERYGTLGTQVRVFSLSLIFWLFMLSLGIGIFNLIPIGPIDGGRMLRLVATKWWPSRGNAIWTWTSMLLLGLVILNLLAGWF